MASAEQTVRVGIIGGGGNTRLHHIPKLQAQPGVEVTHIASRSVESASKVAQEFGIPHVARTWKEIVEDSSIDAVCIGTWPYTHHAMVTAALHAGKHVLTEARLAATAREARDMLQTSLANPHLVAQVVPSPITLAVDRTIQDLILGKALGELLYIEVRTSTNAFPSEEGPLGALHWREDPALSGVNLGPLGIFYEPLQRWVGDAKSVRALAKTVTKLKVDGSTGEPRSVGIPDHVDVLAEMECGAHAHFLVTSALGPAPFARSGFVLYGSAACLSVEVALGQAPRLSLCRRGSTAYEEVPIAAEKKEEWRVEEEFIQAIRGQGRVRRTDFAQGACYMEFTEVVRRSSQSGSVVHLPLFE